MESACRVMLVCLELLEFRLVLPSIICLEWMKILLVHLSKSGFFPLKGPVGPAGPKGELGFPGRPVSATNAPSISLLLS